LIYVYSLLQYQTTQKFHEVELQVLAVQLNQMEMTSAQTLHTEGLIKQGILLGKQKNLRQVISEISK